MKKLFMMLLLAAVFSVLLYGAENMKNKSKINLHKVTSISDVWFDINRMNGVFRNNGIWHYDCVAGDWGLEWPKGSGFSPMFAAGQWIGAKFPDSTIRVAGIQHSATEYQPGEILEPFVAANPTDSKYRWYELRGGGAGDWSNWPLDQGAPVDEDGNPALIGDMTIFSVWNDLAEHAQYNSQKLSVEVRQTVFGFNRADALGDMQFMKWQLVNKSGVDWDSTYFCIWTDPDLGAAGDDLVGCDTTLGLGYCYNATDNDQIYGGKPPAIGLDFFQGPIIDNPDSTVTLPNGTVIEGKEMLKMTSFIFYNNEDSPQGNPDNAGHVWNYFRAYWQDNTRITMGGTGTDPSNPPTNFMFSGDPETGEGWMDSNEDDRRFIMTTGPFTMKKWEDTNGNDLPDFGEPGVQEIVAGMIVARGSNNLNSVTTLKEVDELAQLAYDMNFKLAKPPISPIVMTTALPNEVVLVWDEISEFNEDAITPYESADPIVAADFGKITKTITLKEVPHPDYPDEPDSSITIADTIETVIDDSTYNFYGYTVYQCSDASGKDPVQIDHWDIGKINEAAPYTEKHFSRITENKNSVVGNVGDPLTNGKEYYFSVIAQGYLGYGSPQVLPSSISASMVTVVPQYESGARYQCQYNDTVSNAQHLRVDSNLPASEGRILVWVVDPSKVTGDEYKVIFHKDTLENIYWDLINTTDTDTIFKNLTNQTGNDAYLVVDGLMIKVLGPLPGIHGAWQTANANGPISGVETEDVNENIQWINFLTAPDYPTEQAGGGWFFVTHGGGTANDEESFVARIYRNDNWTRAAGNVFEMRFTAGGGKAWMAFTTETVVDVPFEVWNMGPVEQDTTDDYRMIAWTLDDNGNDVFDWSGDDPGSGADNDASSDWIYWRDPADTSPGTAGYDACAADPSYGYYSGLVGGEVMARTRLMNWNCYASNDDTVMLVDFPHPDTSMWDASDTTFMLNRGWFLDGGNSKGVATISGDTVFGLVLHEPDVGTIIRWIMNKPNTPNDYFTFTAADAKTLAKTDLKTDIKKINVVPNPYYGYHSGEMNVFDRWVQFTYLPEKCTIRIFDLAGNLVRRLEKNDASTSLLRWDLLNSYNLPVASGIYVYLVEVPEVGEKVGKMAIFAPSGTRLDTY